MAEYGKDDFDEARHKKKLRELEADLDPDVTSDRRRRTSLQSGEHETPRLDPYVTRDTQQARPPTINDHRSGAVTQAVSCAQRSPVNIQDSVDTIEWEPVQEPDEALLCGICFQLLKEPRLLSCCGEQNACVKCIEKAGIRSKACPFCRSEDFKLIPNNDLKVAIEKLEVWCHNKEEGCKWSGSIGEAKKHLTACQHASIPCPRGCGLTLKRYELSQHTSKCYNKPIPCRFVNIGCKATFPQKDASLHDKDNVHNHLLQIAHRNETIRKAALSSLQAADKSVEQILAEKQSKVMSLKRQLSNSQTTVKSLEEKVEKAKKQLHTIREEHHVKGVHYTAELQAKGKEILQLLTVSRGIQGVIEKLPVPPVEGYTAIPVSFTVDNFSVKKQNDEKWISPPFYTHIAGYKMCMAIYPNGDCEARGTHLSVYLYLMQGENDNYLPWPFPGAVITILFLNQRGTVKNMVLESFGHSPSYLTIEDTDRDFCARVTDGTRNSGLGFRKAIGNSRIGRYVVNDVLRVKVHSILFLPL